MSRKFYGDSSLPRGSRSVEFFRATDAAPDAAVSIGEYDLEADTPSRPSTMTERRGTKNEATGWAASADFDTLSGTAQLESDASNILQRYDWFIATFDADIGPEKWVILEVSQPEGQNDAKKQTFSCHKDLTYVPS